MVWVDLGFFFLQALWFTRWSYLVFVSTWRLLVWSQSNSTLDAQRQGHQTLFSLGSDELKNSSCPLICLCKCNVLQAQSGIKSWLWVLLVWKQNTFWGPKRDLARFVCLFLLKACLPMGEFLPSRLKPEASAQENVILYEKEKPVICSGFMLFLFLFLFGSFWLARNEYTL